VEAVFVGGEALSPSMGVSQPRALLLEFTGTRLAVLPWLARFPLEL